MWKLLKGLKNKQDANLELYLNQQSMAAASGVGCLLCKNLASLVAWLHHYRCKTLLD